MKKSIQLASAVALGGGLLLASSLFAQSPSPTKKAWSGNQLAGGVPKTQQPANLVGAAGMGFESDQNAVTLVMSTGDTVDLPLASKREIADRIFDEILKLRLSLHAAHGR